MTNGNVERREPGFIEMLKSKKMLAEVAKVCPGFLDPQQLFRVAQTQFRRTPLLQKCTPGSLMSALMDCAVSGLYPDGRNAHLVPYGDEATFVPDWKGLVKLGSQSNRCKRWRADVVHEKDVFRFNMGRLEEHSYNHLKPRGEIVGFYSHIIFENGEEDLEYMTRDEVDKIKERSLKGKKRPEKSPWTTDYAEMGKKTPVKRLSKRLGHLLSKEFEEAITRDAESFDDIQDVTVDVEDVTTDDLTDAVQRGAANEEKKAPEKETDEEPGPDAAGTQEADAGPDAGGNDDEGADAARSDMIVFISDHLKTLKSAMKKSAFLKQWDLTGETWESADTAILAEIAGRVGQLNKGGDE